MVEARPMSMGDWLLVMAGCASALVALLHLAIVLAGSGYRYFGGRQLGDWAATGSPWPAVLTLVVTAVFAVFAVYAFSGAGRLPRLPLLRLGLLGIGAIYILRGLQVVPELMARMRSPALVPARIVVFSLVSLAIGLLYAAGTASAWTALKMSRPR